MTELEPAIGTMAKPLQRRLENEATRELIDQNRQDASAVVSKCIGNQNLFTVALNRVINANENPEGRTEDSIRNDLHVAALWLLLTLSKDSADLLEVELDRNVGRGWREASFKDLMLQFEALVAAQRVDARPVNFLFACAAVLAANGVELPTRLQELQRIVVNLLQREDIIDILLRMNVVGWVSLILLAQRTSSRSMDNSLLRALWNEGRLLREARNQVIGPAKKAGEIKTAIDERFQERVKAVLEIWAPPQSGADGGEEDPQAEYERFLFQLREASFWGPPLVRGHARDDEVTEGASLSGVLRVRAVTNRVELETPGYNQMFLYPFSAITGMNISNLRSLRREFGDKDAELVRLMGETVVARCYERIKGEFRRSGRNFEERTKFITDALTFAKDTTKAFDDLLAVKKGPEGEGERWVYRTALIQARPGGFIDKVEDRVISWRFVEMPDAVLRWITEGSRIEELRKNDRAS